MKKRILTLALALLLFPAMGLPALADTSYTGEINPETGQPYGANTAEDTGDLVALSDSMYYSWVTHDYVYRIPDSMAEVHVSVADGMVVTTPVSVAASSEAVFSMYRNGSEYTGDLTSCALTGEYVISTLVGGTTRRLMSFTVVGETTNAVSTFVVPDGFYIVDATRDGESVYLDRYSVDMEPEGSYVVEYECSVTNRIYKLETKIDRTPPQLTFQGSADSEGRIRSRLDFQGLETGDRIYLTRGGEEVSPTLNDDGSGSIYDPGSYVMKVTDAAGNSVEYSFIILQYLNMQSWIFFLLVFAIIAAIILYVVIQRKRLKIG